MYFQELFTESKKLAVLSFSVVAKLARTPKSYTFLDFWFFQSQNWAKPFYLAPDKFWNPIFGQVVAFYEFSKRYLGIWLIFWFWVLFGGREPEKSDFLLIFANFSSLDSQKWPKMEKLAKFPSNVWKTHKMQQLGQKWGSKSYLDPKKMRLPNLAKKWFLTDFCQFFTFEPPKMAKNKKIGKIPK